MAIREFRWSFPTLFLPIHARARRKARTDQPASKNMRRRLILQGRSALIVDDNKTNRIILTEILTQWGIRSQAFESAESALSALNSNRRESTEIFTMARYSRSSGFRSVSSVS